MALQDAAMRVFNDLINTTIHTAYGSVKFCCFWDPEWVSATVGGRWPTLLHHGQRQSHASRCALCLLILTQSCKRHTYTQSRPALVACATHVPRRVLATGGCKPKLDFDVRTRVGVDSNLKHVHVRARALH